MSDIKTVEITKDEYDVLYKLFNRWNKYCSYGMIPDFLWLDQYMNNNEDSK